MITKFIGMLGLLRRKLLQHFYPTVTSYGSSRLSRRGADVFLRVRQNSIIVGILR
jgi:hypothetical protein